MRSFRNAALAPWSTSDASARDVFNHETICGSIPICYSAPMIKRVILLVVEGLGVGATDDASTYGDTSCHTLAHLAESAGGLSLPTLESLGLGPRDRHSRRAIDGATGRLFRPSGIQEQGSGFTGRLLGDCRMCFRGGGSNVSKRAIRRRPSQPWKRHSDTRSWADVSRPERRL